MAATPPGNAVKDFFRVKNRSLQERRKKARLLPVTAQGHTPSTQKESGLHALRQDASAPEEHAASSLGPGSSMSGFSTTWSFMAMPNGSPSIWLFWPSSGSWSDQPTLHRRLHTSPTLGRRSLHTRGHPQLSGPHRSPGHLDQPIATLALATLPALPGTMRTETLARRPLAGPGRRRLPHQHATPTPNEQAFCAPPAHGHSRTAKYRKKKRKRASSQACRRGRSSRRSGRPCCGMGLRLPWSWKNGPSYSNERDHFRQLLAEQQFPARARCFVPMRASSATTLWKAIQDAGHSFLIRVGANVTLLREVGLCA